MIPPAAVARQRPSRARPRAGAVQRDALRRRLAITPACSQGVGGYGPSAPATPTCRPIHKDTDMPTRLERFTDLEELIRAYEAGPREPSTSPMFGIDQTPDESRLRGVDIFAMTPEDFARALRHCLRREHR